MDDRAAQDEVIRYLADGGVRAHESRSALICSGEAAKAAQFAHFLARRYYRDRLARSFRYSRRFRKQTGQIAEEVAECAEFDHFLSECVMGSLESARQVGRMTLTRMRNAPAPGAWWHDLLDYEYAYFLQAATSEPGVPRSQPSPGVSAVCRRFEWALPEMLPRLRAGQAIEDNLRREVTIVFSRTHTGRIYVVEVEPELERIFRATDGQRTVKEIAEAAGVPARQARAVLLSLANIGAVQLPSSSEHSHRP